MSEKPGSPLGSTYCDGPHTGIQCPNCVTIDGKPALPPENRYSVVQVRFMGDSTDREILATGTLREVRQYIRENEPEAECGKHFKIVNLNTNQVAYYKGERRQD